MTLAQPFWLLLLLLIPLLIRRHYLAGGQQRRLVLFMSDRSILRAGATWRVRVRNGLPGMRWMALGLMALALARPQRQWQEQKIEAEAVDIVLALDISPSMLSRDFEPDRLQVAKRVASAFVQKRPYDRLGLVAFSAEAFTQCPLTTDRRVVQQFLNTLEVGRLEDGTAIGMGLATALNRLKDSPSKSRVVILLTDGENNAGYISPLKAAELAQTLGIRVYTVGIGTNGIVMSPARRNADGSYDFAPRAMEFNTDLLGEIAALTGAQFYRAWSEEELEGIYAEIDQLEKTKMEIAIIRQTTDYFHWFLAAAVVFLLTEALLRWTVLRSVTI
ncbi:MAG: VWA domain-containing protein [Saprospirales bacterium]|nr:VWA domain-containing protein [Saprospirales bacterium]MBK8921901.1 VWA domain-containing protein [Saprospirales bacterium]